VATDPIMAEERCRANTISGFSYQTLVMFESHLIALDVGDHVLHHSYDTSKKEQ